MTRPRGPTSFARSKHPRDVRVSVQIGSMLARATEIISDLRASPRRFRSRNRRSDPFLEWLAADNFILPR